MDTSMDTKKNHFTCREKKSAEPTQQLPLLAGKISVGNNNTTHMIPDKSDANPYLPHKTMNMQSSEINTK